MFKLRKILNGKSAAEPKKIKTKAGVAYTLGSLLKLTAGEADNCTATDTPLFLCGCEAGADEREKITVYPIDPAMVFEAPVSAAPTALHEGDKVTLSLTGQAATGVTATTDGGVALIYDLEGAIDAADRILVRFA